jgi:hypothetical protein
MRNVGVQDGQLHNAWSRASSKESVKRTVADAIADALERHAITFVLGQSVPTAVILACEDGAFARSPIAKRIWGARWRMDLPGSPVASR